MPHIEIHIKGGIDPAMTDWFQGMSIQSISAEESCLCCDAADKSTIYGILSTLGTLGLSLISVSVTDHEGTHTIPTSPNKD
jgi:hypothetical protein